MFIRTQNDLPYTSFKQSTLLTTTAQKEELKVLKLSQTTVLAAWQNHYRDFSILKKNINFKFNLALKIWKKTIGINRTVNSIINSFYLHMHLLPVPNDGLLKY
jgi:hypothetical protein